MYVGKICNILMHSNIFDFIVHSVLLEANVISQGKATIKMLHGL